MESGIFASTHQKGLRIDFLSKELLPATGNLTSTVDLGGMMGVRGKALAMGQAVAPVVSQSHLESHCLAPLLFPGPFEAGLDKALSLSLCVSDFLLPSRGSLPLS